MSAERFEAQASRFDARAGLPASVRARIAEAVLELGRVRPDGLLLEIGAGTGEVGVELARRAAYVGLDLSDAMLEVFRARAETSRVTLLSADASLPWPLPDGSVSAVFGSRSLHLLPPAHVVREAIRVLGSRGGALLIGRVAHDPGSPRARLRRRMRALLEAPAQDGEVASSRLIELLCARGAVALEPRGVAQWLETRPLSEQLREWSRRDELAGVALDESDHRALLARLTEWTRAEIGDLSAPHESTVEYVLEGARFSPVGPPL